MRVRLRMPAGSSSVVSFVLACIPTAAFFRWRCLAGGHSQPPSFIWHGTRTEQQASNISEQVRLYYLCATIRKCISIVRWQRPALRTGTVNGFAQCQAEGGEPTTLGLLFCGGWMRKTCSVYHNYVNDYGSGCSTETIWVSEGRLPIAESRGSRTDREKVGRRRGCTLSLRGCVVTEAAYGVVGNEDWRTSG